MNVVLCHETALIHDREALLALLLGKT